MTFYKLCTNLFIAMLLSFNLWAGQGGGRINLEQQFEKMAAELNLTEEQKTAVRPILEDSFAKRRAVMEKHGVGPGKGRPDRKTMRSMRPEMQAIRQDTDQQLSGVLSDEQMKQLQQKRKEARARMREYAKDRQPKQGQ